MSHLMPLRRMGLVLLLVVSAGLALTRMTATGRASAVAADTPLVTLAPATQAYAGELIVVRLLATNVHNLAGFQSTVRFDPANLRLTGASVSNGLAAGGRALLQLGPVLRDGAVAIGAATCPTASCTDRRFASAPRAPAGLDGQVELATISFYTETPARYQLTLEGVQLVDPQGGRLAAGIANTTIDVTTR